MKSYLFYLIIIIFNIYINNIKCVTLEDLSDPIYYVQTPWGAGVSYTKCSSIFYLYVSTDSSDPIYQIDITSGLGVPMTIAQNELYTQVLFGIVVSNFDFGDYSSTIEIRINSQNYYHVFNYSCIDVNLSKIKYEIIQPLEYDYSTQYFKTLIMITGLNYSIPYIETTTISTVTLEYSNYYSVNFFSPPSPDFLTDWQVQLSWNYQPSITLYFPSPFNKNLNNSIGSIKRYPDENIIPHYFGMYSVGCFSFISTVKTQFTPPYFQFFYQHGGFFNYLPVYGTLGNYTYLGPLVSTSRFIYNEKELQTNGDISLYTQVYDQFEQVYFGELNFYFFYLNASLSGSASYSQNSTNLLLSFNPIVKDYSHTPIRIEDDYGMMTVPWPYGHGKGNLKQFNLDISISRSSPRPISNLRFTIESNEIDFYDINSIAPSPTSTSTTETSSDITSPTLVSFNSTLLFDQVILLKLRITDDISGVASINTFYEEYNYFSNLVSGDKMDGVYEIYFERTSTFIQYALIVTDNSGNTLYLRVGDFYKASPDGMITLPPNIEQYYVEDIEDISFLYNYVDTSGKSYFNKMFIKFKNNKITQGTITASFSFTYSYNFQSYSNLIYNSTSMLWEGYFQMPPNLQYSTVFYTIFTYRDRINYITSTSLRNEFQLRVYSNNTDLIGPLFKNIKKILPVENTSNKEHRFGWNFIISDHLNGFKQGKIMVKGDLDNSVYNFTITPDQAINGDQWEGEYEIMISVNSSVCASMNYTITYVELFDNYLFKTLFQQTSMLSYNPQVNPQLNPFLYYLNDSFINTIPLKCFKSLNPYYPDLISFTVSKSDIDVGSENRVVIVLFEVSDNFGLKEDQLPVVYFQSNEYDIVSAPAQLYSQNNYTNYKFNCTIELPVGFAYPNNVILSVYGIINRSGNWIGYSSSSLSKKGFQYKLDTKISFPENQVILDSARYSNGELWIKGKGLKYIQSISISGVEFSFIPSIVDSSIHSLVKISDYQPSSSSETISIKATTLTSTLSNSIQVPIVYPIYVSPLNIENNAQQKCPGIEPLVCGGPERGTCDISVGCICKFPWIGLDCSSKQITNIEPPIPNQLEPSFILSINQNQTENIPASNITSSVSLIELREINILGQIVNTHKFNHWIFSMNTNTSELYYNTTINNNNFETLIQVVLKWFDNQQQVIFANEKYTIEPATMKFSMKMSEYKFSSELNYLELVLFSSILSVKEESVKCSRAKFGNTTDNCNYFKLQVDNHSLYGKFLRKSIIDNHIVEPINSAINSTSIGNTTQSYYSIQLPHYLDYLEIDPSFSILLDYDVGYSDSDEYCYAPKQVVTRSIALIVGLVIGGVALLASLIILIISLINTNPYFINIKILFLHLKFILLYFKPKR